MDKRITNEQREVIVRNAVAERDRLLEQPTSEVPAVVDPTDPGHDVEVLRNHVRVLERRVRDLHRERNEAPAAKAVRMLTTALRKARDYVRSAAHRTDVNNFIRQNAERDLALVDAALSGAAGVPQAIHPQPFAHATRLGQGSASLASCGCWTSDVNGVHQEYKCADHRVPQEPSADGAAVCRCGQPAGTCSSCSGSRFAVGAGVNTDGGKSNG